MSLPTNYIWTMLAALLLVILQYRLWFDDSGVFATRVLEAQVLQLKEGNAQQQQANEELLHEVQSLRQGDQMLEEYAREELGLVKEGEVFIFFDDSTPEGSAP